MNVQTKFNLIGEDDFQKKKKKKNRYRLQVVLRQNQQIRKIYGNLMDQLFSENNFMRMQINTLSQNPASCDLRQSQVLNRQISVFSNT